MERAEEITMDIGHVEALLFRSFMENGSVRFVVGSHGNRSARLKRLFRYSTRLAGMCGEIMLSQDRIACAVLLDTDRKRKYSLRRMLLDVRLITGCIGLRRLPGVLQREKS